MLHLSPSPLRHPLSESASLEALAQVIHSHLNPQNASISLQQLFQSPFPSQLNPELPSAILGLLSHHGFSSSPFAAYEASLKSLFLYNLHQSDRLLYNKWLYKYNKLIQLPLHPSFSQKLSRLQSQVENWLQNPLPPLMRSLEQARFCDTDCASIVEQPAQDWGDFAGHWALDMEEQDPEPMAQAVLPSSNSDQVTNEECEELQNKLASLDQLAQEALSFQKNMKSLLDEDSTPSPSPDLSDKLDALLFEVSVFLMASKTQKIPDLWQIQDLSQAIIFFREVTRQKILQTWQYQPLILSPSPLRSHRSQKDLARLVQKPTPPSPHIEMTHIFAKLCDDPRANSCEASWLFLGQSMILARGYQDEDLEELCTAISQQLERLPTHSPQSLEFYQYIVDSFRPFIEKYGTPGVLDLFSQSQDLLNQKAQYRQHGRAIRP